MNEILLNMIPNSCAPEVHLSQYDNGRVLRFRLKEGNAEYQAPSGAVVKVKATKPSGLGFIVSGTISDGNIVTVTNTETMTNEAGRFPAELSITSGSTLLGTSNFVFNIERSPHPEGTIDGDAETLLPELTLLVERIEDSNARIESMTVSATPLPSGQNPTASYNPTTNNLDLGIPVADRQYITVDGTNYAITSITKTVVDEVSGLLVAYGTDSTVFIPDGVGVRNVAQILQAQINGKVSAVKLNGDILTPHYDSSFGDGVVDLGTISDDTKADAIVKSASGSIASFSDGGDELPMKSLKVNIVPKQSGSGDPSPSNVRPISGWDAVDVNKSGANIWDEEWESGSLSWASGTPASSSTQIRAKNYIEVFPNTAYYIKTPYAMDVHFYDSNLTQISAKSIGVNGDVATTPQNTRYIRFNVATTTYNHDISINYPSTDTEYHPYDGQTITTNLGQTVYGGVLDVVSGKLVIDCRITDTLDNYYWGEAQLSGGHRFFFTDLPNGIQTKTPKGWCSAYPIEPNDSSIADKEAWLYASTERGGFSRIGIRDDDYTTIDSFKQSLSGVQLVFEVKTPTEIQLTPTEVKSLLGANNIWADAGTVEVEYRADTTLAYNELLNLIANM